ncbi:MAG: hypothetical protein UU54_C0003G0035 [Candidatus Yanofskybacteria bacterium GW2011_GWA2_41_22]|uniref:Uncharacterized protein n=1 Tax=Candidatus Yanofskybacteria bacterium GW2011_GWA2_41_22 TaxID=1619023 RepID=A0A0G0XWV3_9BACT|nr:MAG: hypothetical protein UU54_C0003G0035 [Candidatus Yanofskybacteria bacterium GW2011_GWA2_41_22]
MAGGELKSAPTASKHSTNNSNIFALALKFNPENKEREEKLSEEESKVYELLIPQHKASAIQMEQFTELSEETKKYLTEKRGKARQSLANHRVRDLILEEIELQLKFFMDFADKKEKDTIANKYETLLDLISSLRDEVGMKSDRYLKKKRRPTKTTALSKLLGRNCQNYFQKN